MPIPDYRADSASGASRVAKEVSGKPLPPLPPLRIKPSRLLRYLQAGVAVVLLCLVGWVLLPHLQVQPLYTLLSLLVVAGALGWSWRRLSEVGRLSPVEGCLQFRASVWRFTPAGQGSAVELPEAPMKALVWPWVVILYWPAAAARGPVSLVLMCDAMSQAEFRQLKRWLLLCLRP